MSWHLLFLECGGEKPQRDKNINKRNEKRSELRCSCGHCSNLQCPVPRPLPSYPSAGNFIAQSAGTSVALEAPPKGNANATHASTSLCPTPSIHTHFTPQSIELESVRSPTFTENVLHFTPGLQIEQLSLSLSFSLARIRYKTEDQRAIRAVRRMTVPNAAALEHFVCPTFQLMMTLRLRSQPCIPALPPSLGATEII